MNEIVPKLEQLDGDFPEQVDAIRREAESFEAALKAVEDENRDLVIAIVGRVKSGKSSFLNALLFNGESVLPQAATPMTAALTFIRYDETCHAEVEFFSPGDWETFKKKAAKCEDEKKKVIAQFERSEEEAIREAAQYGDEYKRRTITDEYVQGKLRDRLSEDQRAAWELVSAAAKSGTDLAPLLGRVQRVEGSSPSELSARLQDYVGVGGRYTPIVCSTTIYLNDPGVKGFCIIDTPGTNDPVISRGKKTQDNLKRADVVFVVSPANRFFDHPDLVLCSQNLPANGINCFRVVISQFDISIQENSRKADPSLPPVKRLMDVMFKARNELVGHFRQSIQANAKLAAAHHAADEGKWKRLLEKEDGTPNVPLCVSSLAYILSKHWGHLSASEQEELQRLNKMIPGFVFENGELLHKISYMDSVIKEVEAVKAKKPERIKSAKEAKAVGFRQRIGDMLSDLRKLVQEQIEVLETADLAKLEAELTAQTRLIEQGRANLTAVFETRQNAARDKFAAILSEMWDSKSRYMQLSVGEETHQASQVQYEYRGGLGIMDWLLGPRQVTQYYTYQTRYADAYQAVEQVEAFARRARQKLEEGIRAAVSVRTLRSEIVRAAFDFLQSSGRRDVDVDLLKSQIERTVQSVSVPDADFGTVDYARLITSSFSGGRVEDDQIEALKAAQHEALQAVVDDLEARAREKVSVIEKSIEQAKSSFVDKLISDLKKSKEDLSAKLMNKTECCNRLKSYLPILQHCQE